MFILRAEGQEEDEVLETKAPKNLNLIFGAKNIKIHTKKNFALAEIL